MKVAVFYGGKSCERDISVITALQAMGNMSEHTLLPIYITDNAMYTGSGMQNLNTYRDMKLDKMTELLVKAGVIYSFKSNKLKELMKPDCALICCHGGTGENGCLQGLLEINDIPYTSAGVLASAIGMDKVMMKRVFAEMLLNIVPYTTVTKEMICEDMDSAIKKVESLLAYPVIIKPCTLGSSIGIKIAKDRAELTEGLITASYFDKMIIVETALMDMTEINCAAVKQDGRIIVSACERPISWHEYLSFEDKYINKSKSMEAAVRELPAKLIDSTAVCIKGLTKRIYESIGLNGVVRVDFMIDNITRKVYVNEINTIPGSLSYYLFEPQGMEFRELLDIMLNEGIRVKKINDAAQTSFPSRVLNDLNIVK